MISPPTVADMGVEVPLVDVVGAVTSMPVVLPGLEMLVSLVSQPSTLYCFNPVVGHFLHRHLKSIL